MLNLNCYFLRNETISITFANFIKFIDFKTFVGSGLKANPYKKFWLIKKLSGLTEIVIYLNWVACVAFLNYLAEDLKVSNSKTFIESSLEIWSLRLPG